MVNNTIKLLILSVALPVLLSLTSCNASKGPEKKPTLNNGVIDLRNWNLQKKGSIELVGNWKFYWKRFLTYDTLKAETEEHTFVKSPGVWNDVEQEGKKIGAQGFATFRTTVLVGNNSPRFALKFRDVYSAYAVYINGELIGTVGTPSPRADQAKGINKPTTMSFMTAQEQFDILIHVSNFKFMYGGIPSPITIGHENDIQAERENSIAFEMLIAGAIFFIGMYHLILFLLRKKEHLYLFFAVHCFGMIAYGAVTGECFLLQLVHLNSFDAVLRIVLISTALAFLFLMLFIQTLFSRIVPKPLLRFQIGLFSLLAISGIVMPMEWVQYIHVGNQFLIAIALLGSLLITVIATMRRYNGARIILAGFIFLFLTAFNDLAHYHSVIDTSYLISLGLLILCLSETIVLSIRMNSAFFEVETLSESLNRSNKRLQKLDELKNDFLARTSHELKTPLNGIIGTAEVLIEKSGYLLPAEDLASLSAIVANSSRLTLLINDILDYSKLQKKEIALYRSAVDINACARLVVDLLKPLFDRKKLELTNHLFNGLPLVYADDSRLQQILYNLIGNAIKFTPEGGSIELSAKKQGMFLSTIVKDSGCGISENDLENVFIPFEQVESPNDLKKTGTGLGLSITKNLVELHGGSISIASAVGAGTQIEFLLPLYTEDKVDRFTKDPIPPFPTVPHQSQAIHPSDQALTLNSITGERKTDGSNPTLLIVDDEPINLTVLINQLSMAGYNTIAASTGVEAIGMIEENEIDLVLLDYMMTDLNGFEVLKKIREVEGNPASFPVIMITAFLHSDTAAKCFEQGANDYLYKPVKKEDLLMRVKNQLDIKEKAELSERLKTYQKIDLDLRRLKKIEHVINILDEKIIIAQPNRIIAFCNQPATEFLGFSSQELHGKSLDLVISRQSISKLWDNMPRSSDLSRVENTLLESRITVNKKTGEKIQASISISQFASHEGHEFVLILKAAQGTGLDQKVKEQAVNLMNNCLWLWETHTGKTKLQLAKESGIWTVSYDSQKGLYKAQTMEKYLKIKTFPSKRPRINAIINTIIFILDQEEIPFEKKKDLKSLLNEFSDAKQATYCTLN